MKAFFMSAGTAKIIAVLQKHSWDTKANAFEYDDVSSSTYHPYFSLFDVCLIYV